MRHPIVYDKLTSKCSYLSVLLTNATLEKCNCISLMFQGCDICTKEALKGQYPNISQFQLPTSKFLIQGVQQCSVRFESTKNMENKFFCENTWVYNQVNLGHLDMYWRKIKRKYSYEKNSIYFGSK